MFLLICFLFFPVTNTNKCSFETALKYEHTYLCREKINSTSIRVWLHLKSNDHEQEQKLFFYYQFTLRTIDLLHEHTIRIRDRLEKQITDDVRINFTSKENHTINIHSLPAGRYEICVNFLNDRKNFYYRSSNSCIYLPWHVPDDEMDKPNHLMQVLLLIGIIILLATIAFFIYAIHQCIKSGKYSIVTHNIDDTDDEDRDNSERAKLLINKHLKKEMNPLELLIRRRIHQRYAHPPSD